MNFEYTSFIYVDECDLEEIANRVKNGEPFDDVFSDVMAGYDDCDYYNCSLIEDKVFKEIEHRIGKDSQ